MIFDSEEEWMAWMDVRLRDLARWYVMGTHEPDWTQRNLYFQALNNSLDMMIETLEHSRGRHNGVLRDIPRQPRATYMTVIRGIGDEMIREQLNDDLDCPDMDDEPEEPGANWCQYISR